MRSVDLCHFEAGQGVAKVESCRLEVGQFDLCRFQVGRGVGQVDIMLLRRWGVESE
jgi:hypothetical protein